MILDTTITRHIGSGPAGNHLLSLYIDTNRWVNTAQANHDGVHPGMPDLTNSFANDLQFVNSDNVSGFVRNKSIEFAWYGPGMGLKLVL